MAIMAQSSQGGVPQDSPPPPSLSKKKLKDALQTLKLSGSHEHDTLINLMGQVVSIYPS